MQKFLHRVVLFLAIAFLPWSVNAQVWTCSFEDERDADEWTLVNDDQDNQWFIGSAVSLGHGHALYISDNNGASHSYSGALSYVYAIHPLQIDSPGNYEVTFDWLCRGESTFDFLRVALVPATENLTAGSAPAGLTASAMPSSWTALDGGSRLNRSEVWQNQSSSIYVSTPGDYLLVFYWRNDATTFNLPPAAVDNVTFGQSTCPHPTNITTSVNANSATITWTATGSASEWLVTWDDGVSSDFLNVFNNSVTLTNLTPDTYYSFSVTTVCGRHDNSVPIHGVFHTPCAPVSHVALPYIQDFEEESLNSCWFGQQHGGLIPYPLISHDYAHSGSHSLYMYGYGSSYYSYAVLPFFEDSINNLMLSMWLLKPATTNGTVTVGVIDDPEDFSTFHPLGSLNPPSDNYTWGKKTITFPNYHGSGYFCIAQNTSYYVYIDDVEVSTIPPCAPIANIEVTNVSSTAARVEWQPDPSFNNVSGYEVMIVDAEENENIFYDTTNCHLFSGLNVGETYTVSVRSLCGENNYGSWETTTFTTDDCIATSQRLVGSTSSGYTTEFAPSQSCYEYAYSQMIYTSSQMVGPRSIGSIGFYLTTPAPSTRSWTLYLGETSRSSFSSVSDYIPASQMTNVGTYSFDCSHIGWVDIVLDSPFDYSGSSNLVLAVSDNTGEYACTPYWAANNAINAQVLYFFQDGTSISPSAPSANIGSGFSYNLPTVRFGSACEQSVTCAPPLLFVGDVQPHQVSLYWAPGYQESAWNVEYKAENETEWTPAFLNYHETECVISELDANVNYFFRVISLCSDSSNVSYVSALTSCAAMAVPFFEDFENWGINATSPSAHCWDRYSSYSSGYPYVTTNYALSGSKSMYLYSGTNSYSILILPELMAGIDSLTISFALMRTNASYNHELYVGVISDPEDINSFETFRTVNPPSNTYEWDYVEIDFANYMGNGGRIALLSPSGPTSYPYVDNISVDYTHACLTPDEIDVVTSAHSASLAWNSQASYFEVAYGPAGSSVLDSTMTFDMTSENNYTINNLEMGKRYTFFVRALCDNGDTSNWSFAFNFTTDCGMITHLPYVETFSSWGAGTSVQVPACWSAISTYSSNYPYISASYDHTGDNGASMYFYLYTGNGGQTGFILPEIDVDSLTVNTLQLEFWAKPASFYTNGLVIGVTDYLGNNFTPVDTVMLPDAVFSFFEVPLNGYTGSGTRIAMQCLVSGGNYEYAYIDDIRLVQIPTCLTPADLSCTYVSATSADLVWTGNASSYEVYYGEYGTDIGDMSVITTNANAAQITGLANNTHYSVYVKGICSPDDYSHTAATDFVTLRCMPETSIPYLCTFADTAVSNAWTLLNPDGNSGNKWFVGSATYNGTSDQMALYISNDSALSNNYGSSATAVYAYRDFILDEGEYAVAFDWKAGGESSYDYIRAFLAPASVSLTPGTLPEGASSPFSFANLTPQNWISLDNNAPLNLSDSWSTNLKSVSISDSGVYRLLFLWANDGAVCNPPAGALDNILVIENACPWITNLHATHYTDDSVCLAWTPGGSEGSWSVTVNDSFYYTTNTPSITVGGLSASTDYAFLVRALCSDADSSLGSTLSVTTRCPAVAIPYFENFDNITSSTTTSTGARPDCWDFVLTNPNYSDSSSLPQVYYSGSYAHSGNYSLRLNGVGYHILPLVSVPLDSLQISFYYSCASTSYGCEVGVMEGNTFIPVESFEPAISSTYHSVYLNGYSGPSRTIAFRNYFVNASTGYSYVYLDDITVDYLPPCPHVSNLANPTASMNSVHIDWNGSSAPSFEVRYGVHGTPVSQCTGFFTATHPVSISGLDTSTNYDVYVRPLCSVGDTGDWASITVATAGCDDAAIAGIGTTATNGSTNAFPVNTYYNYSLSETIIDSVELATTIGTAEISSIAFYYDHSQPLTNETDVSVYLQPTTKHLFASNSDILLLDTTVAVKVYQGEFNFSQGWNEIPLDTAFAWSGNGNLMLIIDDNSGDYDGNSYTFLTSATSGNKSLCWYSDTQNPDPLSSSFSGSKMMTNARVVMKLTACGAASCKTPVLNSVENISYNGATISWTSPASHFEVIFKAISDDTWSTEIPVSAPNYAFSALQPLTTYLYRVRAICDETSASAWSEGFFTTSELPCLPPTQLEASNIAFTSAHLAWTTGMFESNWSVRVWNSTFDTTCLVHSNPETTISGLIPDVEYHVAVLALCGDNGDIPSHSWSDTITFTTNQCNAVSNITTTVNGTSATISWTPGANNNGAWQVRYGYEGFANGEQIADLPATSNTITLSNLETFRTYDIYVRAKCEESVYSNWSTKVSFYVDQVGINSVSGNELSIYPNPATGTTTISLSGIAGSVTINMVDMNGRLVRTDSIECDGTCQKTINIENLSQGAYFVRITSDNFNAVKKLIVK